MSKLSNPVEYYIPSSPTTLSKLMLSFMFFLSFCQSKWMMMIMIYHAWDQLPFLCFFLDHLNYFKITSLYYVTPLLTEKTFAY